jgi:hypothetical protein
MAERDRKSKQEVRALQTEVRQLRAQLAMKGYTEIPKPCDHYQQGDIADDVCRCGAAKFRHETPKNRKV